jgi:hypothetical protein
MLVVSMHIVQIIVIPSLIFCSHFFFIALLMSENLPFDTHMLVHGMQSNL